MVHKISSVEKLINGYDEDFTRGCWNWTKAKHNGYGHIWDFELKTHIKAHRLSYEHFRGKIPQGLEIDHLCRNRSCVNPWHMEPVTRKVNAERGYFASKTHCSRGHELIKENLLSRSNGKRDCRICANIRRTKAAA